MVARSRPWAWILTGLLAVLVIIDAQLLDARGLLEHKATWWRPVVQVPAHLVLLLCWWQVGPRFRRPLVAAAIWAAPMLATLPLHSRDAHSYVAQGWLLNAGLDPYAVSSGEAGQAGLLVGIHWFDSTSVYPGLALKTFQLVEHVFHPSLFGPIIGLRLVNVVAFAILAVAIAKIADHYGMDRRRAWWMGVANPVLLVQWIGGVHNDAVMVALIAVALALALRRGWLMLALSGVALGAAMGIKQSAALAGLGLVAIAWEARLQRGTKGWPALAATAVLPGLTTILSYVLIQRATGLALLGWNAPTAGNPIAASSNAPLSWVASFGRYHELADAGTINRGVSAASVLLIVAAIVALYVWIGPKGATAGRPWLFLCLSLLSFGVIGPAMQPWYLTWIIPFVGFTRLRGWWRNAWWLILAGFTMLPPLQDYTAPYIAMGVAAVVLACGALWVRNNTPR